MSEEKRKHPLAIARSRCNLSQKLLAELSGVSIATVQRAETWTPIGPESRQLLCDFFSDRFHRQVEPQELGLIYDGEEHETLSEPNTENDDLDYDRVLSKNTEAVAFVGRRVTSNVILLTPSQIAELLHPLVENRECVWTYAWGLGEEISNIELVYDSAIQYESTLPDEMRQAFDDWCRKNQTKCNEKKRDPVGALVRLEKAEWSHSAYKYFVLLAPSRYLTYVAIHPHLGKAQLRPLREAHFDNALNGLRNGETLGLPSNFALHMAVVSQDGYLLLRRRASNTELYPSAWEVGIGEFMHGPEDTPGPEYESGPYHAQFPHFTEDGFPDLFLFLKNAVAEELGYYEVRQENFRLYGFAVEYETLAPKLLVVYNADCTIATLLENAKKARDRARELSSLELTPRAIAEACSSSRYLSWGPTSKLVTLLALRQDFMAKRMEDQATAITGLIDCFEPKKEPADPWEFHE